MDWKVWNTERDANLAGVEMKKRLGSDIYDRLSTTLTQFIGSYNTDETRKSMTQAVGKLLGDYNYNLTVEDNNTIKIDVNLYGKGNPSN